MTLLALRQSARDTLAGRVKDAAQVHTHGGRFDAESLKQYAVTAPCLVVGVLGMPELTLEGGQTVGDFQWGCFIVTKDKGTTKRDAAALLLLEAVLQVVRPEQSWGCDDAHMLEKIRADNLFSGKLDSHGIALWAVTWRQRYDVNVFDADSELDDFLTYDVVYDLQGALEDTPLPEDTVTLPGPEEE